jgi:hypothetical protein
VLDRVVGCSLAARTSPRSRRRTTPWHRGSPRSSRASRGPSSGRRGGRHSQRCPSGVDTGYADVPALVSVFDGWCLTVRPLLMSRRNRRGVVQHGPTSRTGLSRSPVRGHQGETAEPTAVTPAPAEETGHDRSPAGAPTAASRDPRSPVAVVRPRQPALTEPRRRARPQHRRRRHPAASAQCAAIRTDQLWVRRAGARPGAILVAICAGAAPGQSHGVLPIPRGGLPRDQGGHDVAVADETSVQHHLDARRPVRAQFSRYRVATAGDVSGARAGDRIGAACPACALGSQDRVAWRPSARARRFSCRRERRSERGNGRAGAGGAAGSAGMHRRRRRPVRATPAELVGTATAWLGSAFEAEDACAVDAATRLQILDRFGRAPLGPAVGGCSPSPRTSAVDMLRAAQRRARAMDSVGLAGSLRPGVRAGRSPGGVPEADRASCGRTATRQSWPRSATRSGWRSSRRCSTCRHASAPC